MYYQTHIDTHVSDPGLIISKSIKQLTIQYDQIILLTNDINFRIILNFIYR